MAKRTTSIDFYERLEERGPDVAVDELRGCITTLNEYLAELAQSYPGVVGLGVIAAGQVCGVLVIAPSCEGWQYSPVAQEKVKALARIIGMLPVELLEAFEDELAITKASRGPAQGTSESQPGRDRAKRSGSKRPISF